MRSTTLANVAANPMYFQPVRRAALEAALQCLEKAGIQNPLLMLNSIERSGGEQGTEEYLIGFWLEDNPFIPYTVLVYVQKSPSWTWQAVLAQGHSQGTTTDCLFHFEDGKCTAIEGEFQTLAPLLIKAGF